MRRGDVPSKRTILFSSVRPQFKPATLEPNNIRVYVWLNNFFIIFFFYNTFFFFFLIIFFSRTLYFYKWNYGSVTTAVVVSAGLQWTQVSILYTRHRSNSFFQFFSIFFFFWIVHSQYDYKPCCYHTSVTHINKLYG